MDEQVEKDAENGSHDIRKGKRTRKKRILKNLQNQIEFYFGNANLRHDRFLARKIAENNEGYVPVDLIASFKKLQRISNDVRLIVKAIQNSPLLEINEDRRMVKRKSPVPKNENADARTVYVERLPQMADREWLREVFSCCGHIEYISLPRYKNSKEIKGFAFIEYESPAEAEKACQVLNTVYSMSKTVNGIDYDALIKTNQVDVNETCRSKRRRTSSEDSDECSDNNSKISAPKKRHKSAEDESDTSSKEITNLTEKGSYCSDGLRKSIFVGMSCTPNGIVNKDLVDNKNENNAKSERKKKRRRKKKVKEEKEMEIPPLYVISKKEWIRLKDVYKSLQRYEASKLKKRSKEDGQSRQKKENSSKLISSGKFDTNDVSSLLDTVVCKETFAKDVTVKAKIEEVIVTL